MLKLGRLTAALAAAVISFSLIPSSQACTIWAARGEGVTENGHTIAVQIYDWKNLVDVSIKSGFGSGYDVYGIYPRAQFVHGINEKGLFVASASAPSNLQGNKLPWVSTVGNRRPHEEIARTCGTVDEALKRTDIFNYGYPNFFLLADKDEIALVEALPDGTHIVSRTKKGFRVHTNHFCMKETYQRFKVNHNSDTVVRLKRIRQLLKESPRPMSFEDFIAFSKDHDAGDDKSLFNERSQGVLIADIAPDGKVRMYQRVRKNPLNRNSEWVEEIFDLRERIK